MKIGRISFYLWMLVVLLPLSIHAEPTGHVVYRHPYNYDELWMTDIRDTRNARLLFKHTHVIRNLSVQKNSRYIAILSANGNPRLNVDVYRIDTLRGEAILIQNEIEYGTHIDVSPSGDVVFAGRPSSGDILKQEGIYLIQRSEIGKQTPKIILLKEIGIVHNLDWAPNGKQIVHGSTKGVFILDVDTKNEILISRQGKNVVFSPDGNKLAFSYVGGATGNSQIDIISLNTLRPLKTIKDVIGQSVHPLIWSPDGKYLIYGARGSHLVDQGNVHYNIAIPVNGGPHERILDTDARGVEMFDWINPAYPVEPVNHLTTLWGKIKQ